MDRDLSFLAESSLASVNSGYSDENLTIGVLPSSQQAEGPSVIFRGVNSTMGRIMKQVVEDPAMHHHLVAVAKENTEVIHQFGEASQTTLLNDRSIAAVETENSVRNSFHLNASSIGVIGVKRKLEEAPETRSVLRLRGGGPSGRSSDIDDSSHEEKSEMNDSLSSSVNNSTIEEGSETNDSIHSNERGTIGDGVTNYYNPEHMHTIQQNFIDEMVSLFDPFLNEGSSVNVETCHDFMENLADTAAEAMRFIENEAYNLIVHDHNYRTGVQEIEELQAENVATGFARELIYRSAYSFAGDGFQKAASSALIIAGKHIDQAFADNPERARAIVQNALAVTDHAVYVGRLALSNYLQNYNDFSTEDINSVADMSEASESETDINYALASFIPNVDSNATLGNLHSALTSAEQVLALITDAMSKSASRINE